MKLLSLVLFAVGAYASGGAPPDGSGGAPPALTAAPAVTAVPAASRTCQDFFNDAKKCRKPNEQEYDRSNPLQVCDDPNEPNGECERKCCKRFESCNSWKAASGNPNAPCGALNAATIYNNEMDNRGFKDGQHQRVGNCCEARKCGTFRKNGGQCAGLADTFNLAQLNTACSWAGNTCASNPLCCMQQTCWQAKPRSLPFECPASHSLIYKPNPPRLVPCLGALCDVATCCFIPRCCTGNNAACAKEPNLPTPGQARAKIRQQGKQDNTYVITGCSHKGPIDHRNHLTVRFRNLNGDIIGLNGVAAHFDMSGRQLVFNGLAVAETVAVADSNELAKNFKLIASVVLFSMLGLFIWQRCASKNEQVYMKLLEGDESLRC